MGITENGEITAYINAICSQIRLRAIHEEIRLELTGHLEALVEEYQREGLAENEAVSKAIGQMGSADVLGKQLNRIHRPKPDWGLIALSLLLIHIGLAAMYFIEKQSLAPSLPIFSRSLFFTLMGGLMIAGLYFFDYRKLEAHSLKIYGAWVLVLLGAFVFGEKAHGQVYLHIGPFSLNLFSISPIFFTIALAGILHNWHWDQPKKIFQGILLCLIPFLFLVQESSLSTAVIYSVACLTLMIASGARPRIFLLLAGMLCTVMTALVVSTPYRLSRFMVLINPGQDPLGSGYLQNQLSHLIGNSGLLGQGFTLQPKIIPDLHTDFIFSYITFTFGWIAGGFLAVLVALFIFRMTRIASLVKDNYARLLVTGFTALFTVQFVWNIFMNLGLAPISGVGLPFISFGGSQLVFNGAVLGIISSIYRHRNISSTPQPF